MEENDKFMGQKHQGLILCFYLLLIPKKIDIAIKLKSTCVPKFVFDKKKFILSLQKVPQHIYIYIRNLITNNSYFHKSFRSTSF